MAHAASAAVAHQPCVASGVWRSTAREQVCRASRQSSRVALSHTAAQCRFPARVPSRLAASSTHRLLAHRCADPYHRHMKRKATTDAEIATPLAASTHAQVPPSPATASGPPPNGPILNQEDAVVGFSLPGAAESIQPWSEDNNPNGKQQASPQQPLAETPDEGTAALMLHAHQVSEHYNTFLSDWMQRFANGIAQQTLQAIQPEVVAKYESFDMEMRKMAQKGDTLCTWNENATKVCVRRCPSRA